MKKKTTLTIILALASGCSTTSHRLPSEPVASPAMLEQAIKFESIPGKANIYVRFESDSAGDFRLTSLLYLNGKFVGNLNKGEYFNIASAPGTIKLKLDQDFTGVWGIYRIANGELVLEPGSVVMLDCRNEEGREGFRSGEMRPAGNVLRRSLKQCSSSDLYRQNGVTACLKPVQNRMPTLDQLKDKTLPRGGCLITEDRALFAASTLVTPKVSFITTDKYELEQALAFNSIPKLKKFLADYKNSSYAGEARAHLKALESKQKRDNYETRIQREVARAMKLPPQVRMDRYMVPLTEKLKAQDYSSALFYFEVLDRLGGQQEPEFELFWGEALLRTGNPKEAAERFYRYLNITGSSGQYYTQALQLLSEAESLL